MEEKKYPIYKFFAKWNQDNFQGNGSGISVMYKEEPIEEQLNYDLELFKNNIIQKQIEKDHPVIEWVDVGCKYYEHETWLLGWFNHYTYNQFENDYKVEKSFRDFISRKKKLNIDNGHWTTEMSEESNKPFYCFMGAEDEWRWKICRCDDCKRLGKITIDH